MTAAKKKDAGKVFPPPAVTPEFAALGWDSVGIKIGGKAGQLDVNFCFNTMCGNFGLSAEQANARNAPYRIRKNNRALSLMCPECGQTQRMYNNQAVDDLFLHVLKNHLLHEYCPVPECENHRINVYEHYPERYYRGSGEVPTDPEKLAKFDYMVRCKSCTQRLKAQKEQEALEKQEALEAFKALEKQDALEALKALEKLEAPEEEEEEEELKKKKKSDRFKLGVTWGLNPAASSPMNVRMFMKLATNGAGPSAMADIIECGTSAYYPRLHALARACNAISAQHLMELQTKEFADKTDCVHLYSDIMDISVFLGTKTSRTTLLRILITSTDYGGSFFVLAVTPMFVPGEIDEEKLLPKAKLYVSNQPHAHLQWGGTPIDGSSVVGKQNRRSYNYPTLGLEGYFVPSSYGAIAHFLVLRKMLSRIRRVVHYVDNESVLKTAALTAFADKIQKQQCEVVAVRITQHMKGQVAQSLHDEKAVSVAGEKSNSEEANDKQGSSSDKRPDSPMLAEEGRQAYRKEMLCKATKELATSINTAVATYVEESKEIAGGKGKEGEKKKITGKRYPNERACVYRLAVNNKDIEKEDLNLWVKDPFWPSFEPNRQYLWLTRRPDPGKDPTEKEAELYMHGQHQPVDTYMGSVRQLISTAERSHLIAATRFGRSGYISSPRTPKPVISEFMLHRFLWNFMRRRRSRLSNTDETRNIPRAQNLGLNMPEPLTADFAAHVRRQVYDRAEKISSDLMGVTPQYRSRRKARGKPHELNGHDILTADIAEEIIKTITPDLIINNAEDIAERISRYITADTSKEDIENLAGGVAQKITADIASDLTQIITTWPGTSTKH